MTYLEVVVQALIPVMSIMAVACSQLEVLQRWGARKVAPIIGLMVQPFWIISAIGPKQYGVMLTSVFFSGMWMFAVYEQWFKKTR